MASSRLAVAIAAGAIAFIAVVIAYRLAPTVVRRKGPQAVGASMVAAAVVAYLTRAQPTGAQLIDAGLNIGLAAVVGLAATAANRHVVFVAAALAFVAAPYSLIGAVSLGAAAGAVVLAVKLPAVKALAGGLAGVAVGDALWSGPRLVPALLAIIAVAVAATGGLATISPRSRGRVVGGATVILGLAVAAVALFGLAAISVRSELERGADLAVAGLGAARAGDDHRAGEALRQAAREFNVADRRLQEWWARPVGVVPVAAQNAKALRAMSASGRRLTTAAANTAAAGPSRLEVRDASVPLGLVVALRPPLEELVGAVTASTHALDDARSPWLASPVEENLERLRREVARARQPAADALEMVRVLPPLFGSDGQRRYFLALQTPAELRGAGGVIGSFATLTANEGVVRLERVGSDTELNEGGDLAARRLIGPEDYVARYGGFQPERAWQNVSMSPDFPSVCEVIRGLYPQSGGDPIDGVISLDPKAIAALLRIVGPVSVPQWPVAISGDNAEPMLLHEQYLRFPGPVGDERKAFLAALMRATFDQLAATALPGPRQLGKVFGPLVKERRVMLCSAVDTEQRMFRRIGADGGIRPVAGDYLAVVNQNSSGNKIDWFLRRSTDYSVRFDPATGSVRSTVTVRLENQAPASGLPPVVIGDLARDPNPPGYNRTLLSVYTPFQLEQAAVNGSVTPFQGERERGRNVFSAFVEIPPGQAVTVRLELRGALPEGAAAYRLDLAPQAMVNPEQVTVALSTSEGWRLRNRPPWTASTAAGGLRWGPGPLGTNATLSAIVLPQSEESRP